MTDRDLHFEPTPRTLERLRAAIAHSLPRRPGPIVLSDDALRAVLKVVDREGLLIGSPCRECGTPVEDFRPSGQLQHLRREHTALRARHHEVCTALREAMRSIAERNTVSLLVPEARVRTGWIPYEQAVRWGRLVGEYVPTSTKVIRSSLPGAEQALREVLDTFVLSDPTTTTGPMRHPGWIPLPTLRRWCSTIGHPLPAAVPGTPRTSADSASANALWTAANEAAKKVAKLEDELVSERLSSELQRQEIERLKQAARDQSQTRVVRTGTTDSEARTELQLRLRLNETERANRTLRLEVERLDNALQTRVRETGTVIESRRRLRTNLDDAEREVSRLVTQLLNTKGELARVNTQLDNTRRELARVNTNLNDGVHEVSRMKAELRSSEQAHASSIDAGHRLKAKLDQAERERENLARRAADEASRIHQFEKDATQWRLRYEMMRDALAEVVNSATPDAPPRLTSNNWVLHTTEGTLPLTSVPPATPKTAFDGAVAEGAAFQTAALRYGPLVMNLAQTRARERGTDWRKELEKPVAWAVGVEGGPIRGQRTTLLKYGIPRWWVWGDLEGLVTTADGVRVGSALSARAQHDIVHPGMPRATCEQCKWAHI